MSERSSELCGGKSRLEQFSSDVRGVPEPFVSIVTPFFNTASFLAECIESVITQSYGNFEYILADNCSTDASDRIAESYAAQDSRIRLIRYSEFLSQLRNYNRAIKEISADSKYVKIVQADDVIFPDCLKLMVHAFEQSDSIGLVSSYRLKGTIVEGSGYPYPMPTLNGKECGRFFLRTGIYIFGSQTTVMYRSSIARSQDPFFNESLPHADLDTAMELLSRSDFGFVHQLLSFTRVQDQSITSSLRNLEPYALDRFIVMQKYGPVFLEGREVERFLKISKRAYYALLAREALHFRGRAFWQYHEDGLRTSGHRLDRLYLTFQIGLELFRKASNPGDTLIRVLRKLRPKRKE
jgi:glycosyltransferase involved in cell wall biosynthesis